eukprot:3786483-Pyramimonas_sp.AAC.1
MAAQAANYVALGASRPAGRRAQDQGSHDQEVDRSPLSDDDTLSSEYRRRLTGRRPWAKCPFGFRRQRDGRCTREEPKPQSTAGDNRRRQ